MTIVEKAAYLKGLVEGLGVEPASRDGRLWNALTELLSDMAHEIEDLQSASQDQSNVIDDICEDLSYMEQELLSLGLDDEDLDEFDDEEDDKVYRFDSYDGDEDEDEDEDEDDEDDEDDENEDEELSYDGVLYDVTCPSCGEEITFDEETLAEGGIKCPGCGEILEFDLGQDE